MFFCRVLKVRFQDGSTHPDNNEIIKRGKANRKRINGLINNCLCSFKGCFFRAADRCRAVPTIINKAEQTFTINGTRR